MLERCRVRESGKRMLGGGDPLTCGSGHGLEVGYALGIAFALSLDPLSVLYRVHLGFLFYLRRDTAHAIYHFRKALEINPRYYLAYGMMGPAFVLDCRFDEAIKAYHELVRV